MTLCTLTSTQASQSYSFFSWSWVQRVIEALVQVTFSYQAISQKRSLRVKESTGFATPFLLSFLPASAHCLLIWKVFRNYLHVVTINNSKEHGEFLANQNVSIRSEEMRVQRPESGLSGHSAAMRLLYSHATEPLRCEFCDNSASVPRILQDQMRWCPHCTWPSLTW